MAPSLWLAETFSTSSLKLLNRIQRNLTGSRNSTSSTKFVFFRPIGKPKWPTGLWLAETFLTSSLNPLNEIQWNFTGSKISMWLLYQVCIFQADQKKQDGRPGLWFAETFSTFSLKPRSEFAKTWQEARNQRPLLSLVFFGLIRKTRLPPQPLISWEFFSETTEWKFFWLAENSSLKPLNESFSNLTGSKISTSFISVWKNKMAALASYWLRIFLILLWNRLTEFAETWQEARTQHPLQSLCFSDQ